MTLNHSCIASCIKIEILSILMYTTRLCTVKTSVLFETSVLNMWHVILNYACYFDNHVFISLVAMLNTWKKRKNFYKHGI